MIVGTYTRSPDGTVHLEPCPLASAHQRWQYAVNLSLRDVVALVATIPTMRLCELCWPLTAYGDHR